METESLIGFARDLLQANCQLDKAIKKQGVRRDHLYLYTVQRMTDLKGVEGPSSCILCQEEISKRHPCKVEQVQAEGLWFVAGKLGLESLDDLVYLIKEIV